MARSSSKHNTAPGNGRRDADHLPLPGAVYAVPHATINVHPSYLARYA